MKIIKKICIALFIICFLIICLFLCFAKRTEFSEEERRQTKNILDIKASDFKNNNPSNVIEEFFIDSVPKRDKIVDASIFLKGKKGINEDVKIVSTKNKTAMNEDMLRLDDEMDMEEHIISTVSYAYNNSLVSIDDPFIKSTVSDVDSELDDKSCDMVPVLNSNNKVIIVGDKKDIRGMSVYTGMSKTTIKNLSTQLNDFKKMLTNLNININVYYMLIPLPTAFYLPEKLKEYWVDQRNIISQVNEQLIGIYPVSIYDILQKHKDEEIYLRTDSHWAQRGGYYACEVFAKVASVSFCSLEKDFEEKKVEHYCSSYYRYTEDPRFIECDETFYYYKPKTDYSVKQILYNKNAPFGEHIASIKENTTYFKEGSYSTQYSYLIFMGGDNNTTIVKKDNNTNRRLMIIKDSYGNTLAPNLVYSFDEIHVVDYRWFRGNLTQYIIDNQITDLLLAPQISMATGEARKYPVLLSQDIIMDSSATSVQNTQSEQNVQNMPNAS